MARAPFYPPQRELKEGLALSHHHSLNEILLRDIQPEDTELFYRLLSHPQVMTFSEGMLSREQIDAWLSRFSDDINAHLWVIELKASTQVIVAIAA